MLKPNVTAIYTQFPFLHRLVAMENLEDATVERVDEDLLRMKVGKDPYDEVLLVDSSGNLLASVGRKTVNHSILFLNWRRVVCSTSK